MSAPLAPLNPKVPDLHSAPSTRDWHVMEYVKALYKRRWPAITVFLIVLLGAVVRTFMTTPIFEARTRLLIQGDQPKVVAFEAVVEEGSPNPDYYQTQYGILRSRGLARRTIEAMNLWSSPHFAQTPEDPEASDTATQTAVIDRFQASLTVEPIRNSQLVDVTFRSPDPALAARIANQLANNYIEQSLDYRYTASQDASAWLAARLEEQGTQVKEAEAALQRYREDHDAITLDNGGSIVVQKLSDLNAAVTRAKTERLQKEAIERQLRGAETTPAALDTFPAVLGNSFIQRQKGELADLQRQQAQMSDRLGQRHPDMLKVQSAIDSSQQKLRNEIDKIVQSVHTEYLAALAQEQSLTAALAQQKGEALSMNRKAIEYSVLAREVESGKQIYESLLQRAKEMGVSAELRTSNVRIVDVAEQPRSAFTPQLGQNIFVGALAGLILGIAVAFFFEYIDSRLKSPDEIRVHLGLPSLGMIPALGKRWENVAPLLHQAVPPAFSEMFRALRTNILFSVPDDGPRTLAVTSASPGEGKSMVSSNVAAAFALAGHRVLLIDADMRRSRAHQIFDIDQEPGLSNLLVGNAKASEALRKTSVAGLWVLPAGRTPPNPAELLGSNRFKEFLTSLKGHFDTIIIDTPPVMVVADAMAVANMASGVVFVVGADMTSRHTARAALDQLERVHARLLGAVLNRVDLDNNGYYYAQYYRADYASYYRATGT
jgi:capsular exopolysaccharide synthesis family protein